jgi:hypothetical protein
MSPFILLKETPRYITLFTKGMTCPFSCSTSLGTLYVFWRNRSPQQFSFQWSLCPSAHTTNSLRWVRVQFGENMRARWEGTNHASWPSWPLTQGHQWQSPDPISLQDCLTLLHRGPDGHCLGLFCIYNFFHNKKQSTLYTCWTTLAASGYLPMMV